MPSSHTATAVAYATAASLQHPAATLLSVPAGIVAWSRLTTRRHFPTDVLAAVTLGTAIGLLIGLLARRVGTEPADRVAP